MALTTLQMWKFRRKNLAQAMRAEAKALKAVDRGFKASTVVPGPSHAESRALSRARNRTFREFTKLLAFAAKHAK